MIFSRRFRLAFSSALSIPGRISAASLLMPEDNTVLTLVLHIVSFDRETVQKSVQTTPLPLYSVAVLYAPLPPDSPGLPVCCVYSICLFSW